METPKRIKDSRIAKYTIFAITPVALLLIPPILGILIPTPIQPMGKGDIEFINEIACLDSKTPTNLFTQCFYKYHGTLEGTTAYLETLQEYIRPWGIESKVRMTFSGSVNESKPGVFTAIISGIYNPSLDYPRPFRARFNIVEGSGAGGLEGICGSGEIIGEVPAPEIGNLTAEYNIQISFGKDCNYN